MRLNSNKVELSNVQTILLSEIKILVQKLKGWQDSIAETTDWNLYVQDFIQLSNYYLQRGEYLYAAAIYNYVLNLYRIKLPGNTEQAASIMQALEKLEIAFIQSLGKDPTVNSYPYTKVNQQHRASLQTLRRSCQDELARINESYPADIYDEEKAKGQEAKYQQLQFEKAEAIHQLYHEIAERLKTFIRMLIQECMDVLGEPPCEYAIMGLGSLAREEATPYSDVEFAIVIAEEREDYKDYFRNLTKLLHLKVINLGETILPAMGIPALNDYYSKDPLDNWFYDEITPRGFAFDGAMPHACKTPLGCRTTEGKQLFELIHTPADMVKLQIDKQNLASILIYVTGVYGNINLVDDYRNQVIAASQIYVTNSTPIISLNKYHAKQLINATIENFDPLLGKQTMEGHLFKIKHDIYRLPSLLIDGLSLFYQLTQPSSWDRLNKFLSRGIGHDTVQKLKWLISEAMAFRLETYCYYNAQHEFANPLLKQFLTEELDLIHAQFAMNPEIFKRLKIIYQIIFPLIETAKKLSKGDAQAFSKAVLWDTNPYLAGQIAARLCQYQLAKQYYLKAYQLDTKNHHLLTHLGLVHLRLEENESALEYFNKALNQVKNQYGEEHPQIAADYYNLSIAYENLDQLKTAQSYCKKAIEIAKKAHAIEIAKKGHDFAHERTLRYLDNLGTIYQRLGRYEEAIKLHKEALAKIDKLLVEEEAYSRTDRVIELMAIDKAHSLNNLGLAYENCFQPIVAESHFRAALNIIRQNYGDYHPYIVSLLSNIGDIYQILNKYEEALSYQQKALKITKVIYSSMHPATAASLKKVATLYGDLGNFKKAISTYKEALTIDQSFYGEEHAFVANIYNNLGVVYLNIGDTEKALEAYQKALSIKRKNVSANDDTSIAVSFNNLGEVYRAQGKYTEAIKAYQQALAIDIKIQGEHHSDVALDYNNLGVAYSVLGDFKKSIEYHELALAIRKKVYGSEHSEVALSFNNLSTVYTELKDYTKALMYINNALAIDEKVYGREHPATARDCNNLGYILVQLAQYDKAKTYHKRALDIYQLYYGMKQPEVTLSLNLLGEAFRLSGIATEAIEYYQQAMAIDKELGEENYLNLARDYNNLGLAYHDLKEWLKARECYLSALTIDRKLQGCDEHPHIILRLKNLAKLCVDSSNLEEAIIHYHCILQLEEKVYGKEHSYVVNTLILLGDAYKNAGDIQAALSYYDQALTKANVIFEPENNVVKDIKGRLRISHQSILKQEDLMLKQEIQQTISSNRYEIQSQLFTKLGKLYLQRGEYLYATAIYNYVLNLYRIKLPGNTEQAASITQALEELEIAFIQSLGKDPTVNSYLYTKDNQQHRARLQTLRRYCQDKLARINECYPADIYDEEKAKGQEAKYQQLQLEKAEAIHQLYHEIAEQLKAFIRQLLQECVAVLGEPPCEYAVMGLGSLAREEATPYSDVEFAIVIAEEREDYKDYFRKLTKLLHLKVINLGETILPAMGIPALNDYYSKDPLDNWFYDEITPRGFAFDGAMPHACKTPLGCRTTEGKQLFELIHTPAEMVNNCINAEQQMHKLHLAEALLQPTLIAGNQKLIIEYESLAWKRLDQPDAKHNNISYRLTMAKRNLFTSLKEFEPKLTGLSEEGKLYIVKKEIYRLLDRLIDGLYFYYTENYNFDPFAYKSASLKIEELFKQRLISLPAKNNLIVAVNIATELRLTTYLQNNAQKEHLVIFNPVLPDNTHEENQIYLKRVFCLLDLQILHRYYYTALALYEAITDFYWDEVPRKNFFQNTSFFDNSPWIKAQIAMRLLNYTECIAILQPEVDKLLKQYEANQVIDDGLKLFDLSRMFSLLANAYGNNGDYNRQHECLKKSHGLLKNKSILIHYKRPVSSDNNRLLQVFEHNKAVYYHNLGLNALMQADYNGAEIKLNKALNQYKCLYPDGHHLIIAQTLQSLSNVFLLQDAVIPSFENRYQAKQYNVQALKIYSKLKPSDLMKISYAGCLFNIGVIALQEQNYQEAEDKLTQALSAFQAHYGDQHPSVFKVMNNLGVLYGELGQYERQEALYKKLLENMWNIYKTTQHADYAGCLHNLGNALIRLSRYVEAEKVLTEAKESFTRLLGNRHPHTLQTARDLIRALVRQGNSLFLIKQQTSFIEPINDKVKLLHDMPEYYRKAIKLYDDWLAEDQEKGLLRVSLFQSCGESAYSNHQFIEAMEHYQVASILAPTNITIVNRLKELQQEQNLKQYLQPEGKRMGRANQFILIGLQALENRQVAKAEENFIKALKELNIIEQIDTQETFAQCFKGLGDICLQKQQFIHAAAFYNVALANTQAQKSLLENSLKELERCFLESKLNLKNTFTVNATDDFYSHQQRLAELRQRIATQFTKASQLFFSEEKIEAFRAIYKKIGQYHIDFISSLIKECQQTLGEPPCDYTVIAFGSLAREEATPYSDLEFGILLPPAYNGDKRYFRNLTEYLHLKVINLGETTLASLAINDEITLIKCPIKGGLSFDGAMPQACKTPLGKRDKQGNIIYELIQTPQAMAAYVNEQGFTKDKQLAVTLTNAVSLYHHSKVPRKKSNKAKNNSFLPTYKTILSNLLDQPTVLKDTASPIVNQQKVREERALKLLMADIIRFAPHVGKDNETGKAYPIKYEFYRLFDRIVDDLALFHGLKQQNTFDRIDILCKEGKVNVLGAQHLKQCFINIIQWRLQKHMEAGYQCDEITPTEEELFQCYYVLYGLYEAMKNFLLSEGNSNVLLKSTFYENSYSIKGQICKRLNKYSEAIFYWLHEFYVESSLPLILRDKERFITKFIYDWQQEPIVINFYDSLKTLKGGRTISNFHDEFYKFLLPNIDTFYNEKKFVIAQNILELCRRLGRDTEDTVINAHDRFITEYCGKQLSNHLYALRAEARGKYDVENYSEAKKYFIAAINAFDKKLHLPTEVIELHNLLGLTYYKLKDYQLAFQEFNKGLSLIDMLGVKESQLIADIYHNMALNYDALGQFEQAVFYYEQALKIDYKLYGDFTLDVAHTLCQLARVILRENASEKYHKMEHYLIKAYRIYSRHHAYAINLSVVAQLLGNLKFKQDRLYDAEIYYLTALQVNRREYGANSKEVSTIRDLLLKVYQAKKVHAKEKSEIQTLFKAVVNGHSDVLQELINQGIEVNSRDNRGYTALHHAAGLGHTEIVQLLLAAGADPTIADSEGETPLQWAEHNGHEDVVKLLNEQISKGPSTTFKVSPDKQSGKHWTQQGLFASPQLLPIQSLIQQAKKAITNNRVTLSFTELELAKQLQHQLQAIGIENRSMPGEVRKIDIVNMGTTQEAYSITLTETEYNAIMGEQALAQETQAEEDPELAAAIQLSLGK